MGDDDDDDDDDDEDDVTPLIQKIVETHDKQHID